MECPTRSTISTAIATISRFAVSYQSLGGRALAEPSWGSLSCPSSNVQIRSFSDGRARRPRMQMLFVDFWRLTLIHQDDTQQSIRTFMIFRLTKTEENPTRHGPSASSLLPSRVFSHWPRIGNASISRRSRSPLRAMGGVRVSNPSAKTPVSLGNPGRYKLRCADPLICDQEIDGRSLVLNRKIQEPTARLKKKTVMQEKNVEMQPTKQGAEDGRDARCICNKYGPEIIQ